MDDRRRYPRVEVSAPVFARRAGGETPLARGTAVTGSLLNASRGGVAFLADEAVEPGELVQLSIRTEDGSAVLDRYARVVGCDADPEHGLVARCAFIEPTAALDWIGALALGPAAEPA